MIKLSEHYTKHIKGRNTSLTLRDLSQHNSTCRHVFTSSVATAEFLEAKNFDFKRATVFIWDTTSQNTKWQDMLKIWEGSWLPCPPLLGIWSTPQPFDIFEHCSEFMNSRWPIDFVLCWWAQNSVAKTISLHTRVLWFSHTGNHSPLNKCVMHYHRTQLTLYWPANLPCVIVLLTWQPLWRSSRSPSKCNSVFVALSWTPWSFWKQKQL